MSASPTPCRRAEFRISTRQDCLDDVAPVNLSLTQGLDRGCRAGYVREGLLRNWQHVRQQRRAGYVHVFAAIERQCRLLSDSRAGALVPAGRSRCGTHPAPSVGLEGYGRLRREEDL
jgi:hypothetical protein